MDDKKFVRLCMSGSAEEVIAALNDGANPNAKDTECITALMKAADHNDDTRVMPALLEAGADVRARSIYYMTALDWACGRTPEKLNEKLIILKFAVLGLDVIDDDIFVAFCGYSTPDETRDALSKGANPNAAYRMTALMSAVRKNTRIIPVLIEAGADVNARDNDGLTALMYAEKSETIRWLLDYGAEIDARENNGATSLMLAAKFGSLEIVDALIDAGAYINARDNMRRTPLMYAACNKDTRVITRIITGLQRAGKDINTIRANDGETALMHAAKYCRNAEIIRILLASGAEINARDKNGHTALEYASSAKFHAPEVMQALVDAGAE